MTGRAAARLVGPLAVAAALLLTGCSEDGGDGNDLPERNIGQWVLPLDQYMDQVPGKSALAQRLLVQSCMRDKGYAWQASAAEANAKPGESWNRVAVKLFTPSLAAKYGYGNSDELDLPVSTLQQLRDIDEANNALGSTASEVIDGCFATAQEKLGMSAGRQPQQLAHSLASMAFEDSLDTERVQQAAKKWRVCMRPVGVADLPEAPDLMPSPSISKLSPSVDAPAPLGAAVSVDPEERRVAVADAECRASTGYTEDAYDAEWDAQVRVLRDRGDDLERYDRETRAIDRRAERVISAYTPIAD